MNTNCRWCPTGTYLASAGDDGTVIVWEQSSTVNSLEEDNLESWRVVSMLRFLFFDDLGLLMLMLEERLLRLMISAGLVAASG